MNKLNTLAQLRAFTEGDNKFGDTLGLSNYTRKCSALHKMESRLIPLIDAVMEEQALKSPSRAIHHLIYGIKSPVMCKVCKRKPSNFKCHAYTGYCSTKCSASCPDRISKCEATSLERYGVTHALQSKEFLDKRRDTVKREYGVDNISQLDSIKKRKKRQYRRHYGVDHPFQLPELRDLAKETNLKRYGFESPMQNAEVHARNIRARFKLKDVEIDGVEFKGLHGYEPQALAHLINELDYDAASLIVHPKKSFPYTDPHGKQRMYHPDIKVRGKKHIIEVKSIWTYKGMEGSLAENKAKRDAVVAAGYTFSFLIMRHNLNKSPMWKTTKPGV